MNHFTKLAGLGLVASLFLASCEKDEDRVVMQPGSPLTVAASTNSAVLLQDNASNKVVTYTWNTVDFGYQAAVNYTLQFDKKGGDFSAPIEVNAGTNTSASLTVAELNSILIRLKISPGTSGSVDSRVKASVGAAATPALSAVSTFTGTPYKVFIEYSSLFIAGSYQKSDPGSGPKEWEPSTARRVASVSNNKVYEGYVNFPADTEFKITNTRDWKDGDYGQVTGGPAGNISDTGAKENIKVADPGYYRLTVDLNTRKFTAFKTTWAVVGDAAPNGWGSDTPLTYDNTLGVWKATMTLKAGELKFRSNGDWPLGPDFGDGSDTVAPDGIPDYGGKNIKVATAGTYTVTLDLSQGAGNYSYSIEK
jgi:hypothetical protein